MNEAIRELRRVENWQRAEVVIPAPMPTYVGRSRRVLFRGIDGTAHIGQVAYQDGSFTDIDPRWVRVECTGEEYVPFEGTEWRDIPL